MGVYYCKSCQLLYREYVSCKCGRRLNTTSEGMVSVYLEKGYQFADQREIQSEMKSQNQTRQHENVAQNKTRAQELEKIKKDLRAELGFASIDDMFNPKNVIAGYEKQRKQEEKEREAENQRKLEEIEARRKKAQEEYEAERRRMLGLEPEPKDIPQNNILKENASKEYIQEVVRTNLGQSSKMDTAAFLAGLGLQKQE